MTPKQSERIDRFTAARIVKAIHRLFDYEFLDVTDILEMEPLKDFGDDESCVDMAFAFHHDGETIVVHIDEDGDIVLKDIEWEEQGEEVTMNFLSRLASFIYSEDVDEVRIYKDRMAAEINGYQEQCISTDKPLNLSTFKDTLIALLKGVKIDYCYGTDGGYESYIKITKEQ